MLSHLSREVKRKRQRVIDLLDQFGVIEQRVSLAHPGLSAIVDRFAKPQLGQRALAVAAANHGGDEIGF